jgi:hypothetical protein
MRECGVLRPRCQVTEQRGWRRSIESIHGPPSRRPPCCMVVCRSVTAAGEIQVSTLFGAVWQSGTIPALTAGQWCHFMVVWQYNSRMEVYVVPATHA